MPSYVITGASRGIGLEFVRQLGADPKNTVFALVRNPANASKLNPLLGKNVHLLKADIVDKKALKLAAAEAAKITGGTLDVLINNAAFAEMDRAFFSLTDFEGKEEILEKDLRDCFDVNVIGVIHTINAFLPLLRAGATKKVITISTGVADPDFLEKTGVHIGAPYGISKAATNMVNTKYAIQFKDEGFVFLSLSPGLVDTLDRPPTAEEIEGFTKMVGHFRKVKADFSAPITAEESVTAQLKIINSVTTKDNGGFISHHGNKEWL